MAAWKFDSNDGTDGVAPEPEEGQPLFGNFRRSHAADDHAEKPRSMTEMWGFEGENERREARRRRFWQVSEAVPEHEDNEPWTQFRSAAPVEPEPIAEPEPVSTVESWASPEFVPEPPESVPFANVSPHVHQQDAPEVVAEPATPAASGRNGWRSFLAEVPPAVERPMVPLPKLGDPTPSPAIHAPEPPRDESVARLARRLTSVSSAHPLVMETSVQLQAAVQTCTTLGRSWGAGFEPTVADITIRALARVLLREPALKQLATGIAVLDLGADQGFGCVLESPAIRPFKDTVGELAAMEGSALDEIDISVTDFGLLSIERATPRLAPGQWMALALGARTFGPVQSGESVDWRPTASICLAYDGQRVSDGAAARLLSRLRSLMEAPEDLIN